MTRVLRFLLARTIVAVSIICFTVSCLADENLPRGTLLGVTPTQFEPGQSVVIQNVSINSTASGLGLKPGDQILSVNDKKIKDFQELLAAIRILNTGDAVKVKISRGDKLLTLRGKMQPRPYETSEYATVHYESIKYKGNHLRTITHRPFDKDEVATNGRNRQTHSSKPIPAIFFIQGYTCNSIDYGLMPNVTTRQLIDQFTQAGYVVYRIEKPGIGDSISDQPCRSINFTDESNAFVEGLKALKQKSYVDAEQVFLWGHSLGVLHAPVIATKEPVAGIIGYGGVYKSWYKYMVDIYARQSVIHYGQDEGEAKQRVAQVSPFLDLWLNTNTPWNQVINNPKVKPLIENGMVPMSGDQVFDRHFSFFRDLNGYNFKSIWTKLNVPVFMIHGSLDIQAIEKDWAFDIVKANPNPKSKAIEVQGAEHAFMKFKDNAEHIRIRQDGDYNSMNPGSRFDKRIGELSIKWLSELGMP